MSKSISFYITLLVIKLKGIKNTFKQSPINYLKLRKEDVHIPKSQYFKTNTCSTFSLGKTKITQVNNSLASDQLLIYIHGGAFVSGPTQHHWDSIEQMSKHTNVNIWLCNYPKAPETKIEEISMNIDGVYKKATSIYKSNNIIIMGDSVGGTLAIALTQRLVQNNFNLPSKLMLISPVLDASFTNPKIDEIDEKDPMLSKNGVISAKKMCSENLMDVRISPIHGSFEFFPKTYLYIAENDITSPDQLEFAQKLNRANVPNCVVYGEGMPHIWPLLPFIKESKISLHEIINQINE